jgi:hypothetical protein
MIAILAFGKFGMVITPCLYELQLFIVNLAVRNWFSYYTLFGDNGSDIFIRGDVKCRICGAYVARSNSDTLNMGYLSRVALFNRNAVP